MEVTREFLWFLRKHDISGETNALILRELANGETVYHYGSKMDPIPLSALCVCASTKFKNMRVQMSDV